MREFQAIDIFAGAGGLTVGLKKAGFKVVAAVELNRAAFTTYEANHIGVKGYCADIATVAGKSIMEDIGSTQIDLFACCPPCQGFCSLTSKYKRKDPRNLLISEAARLIQEMQPRTIMLENVPGLAKKGGKLFRGFLKMLTASGYVYDWDILQVADYGIPQMRRRLVLLAGKGFSVKLPKPTHSKTGENGLPKWLTLKSAISTFDSPITFNEAKEAGGPEKFNWHVVRNISRLNVARLRNAIPGKNWVKIPKRLRPPCHQNRKTGFSNVYGRLAWDQVSPTITGGCTTPSKGRFGHPEQVRTISVREAATLQTFPIDYIFKTARMDEVCEMIGNALPCDFAGVLASQCWKELAGQDRLASRE